MAHQVLSSHRRSFLQSETTLLTLRPRGTLSTIALRSCKLRPGLAADRYRRTPHLADSDLWLKSVAKGRENAGSVLTAKGGRGLIIHEQQLVACGGDVLLGPFGGQHYAGRIMSTFEVVPRYLS